MHILVQEQQLTRKEFERGLEGVTDEEARKRFEPMNCISWIVGHLAQQQRAFFVDWPQGRQVDPAYAAFGFGCEASQPPLSEVMELWRASCAEADKMLLTATDETMLQSSATSRLKENYGTLLVRNIFHTWHHIGEINSIRQLLGHKAPQFVNTHGWTFGSE